MTLHITLEGTSPLLMHHPRMADPLDPMKESLAEITGKTKKTKEDHLEIRRLDWYGGLYLGADGRPVIPAANVLAMLAKAATRHRLGKAVEQAVLFSDFELPLIYPGPATADELWASGRYAHVCSVVMQRQRTMRCRPKFDTWSLEFDAVVITEVLDESSLRMIVEEAGVYHGLGDGRRIGFGRFRAVVD